MMKRVRHYTRRIVYALSPTYRGFSYLEKPPGTLTIRYTKNTIFSLYNEGMTFADDTDELHFLDFEECSHNWKAIRQHSPVARIVGDSDSYSKPIYIHFYSNPPVRFEFYWWLPFSYWRVMATYLDFKRRLMSVGCVLYDRT